MRKDDPWELDAQGVWRASVCAFNLVVLHGDQCARFLIARPRTGGKPFPHALVGSGTRRNVQVAKSAAESEAHRLEHLHVAFGHAA
jgi:hypothetical protein